MGAQAYRLLALYDPAPGCLVEVGSERGEGSTEFLAAYARQRGLRFYTADIDPAAHERAQAFTRGARLCSGADLLRRLRTPVSVAYLDGFDWIPAGESGQSWIIDQAERYRRLGFELTNEACQDEHLKEAELVARNAAARCVVICDDTFPTADGRWSGKGGLAVPYLEGEGFDVVDFSGTAEQSLGHAVLRRG